MDTNKVRKSIGIVIPVFNDWASLDLLINKLNQEAAQIDFNLYIIVIDDGSSEPFDLLCVSKGHQALAGINIVRLFNNFGHQRAIAVGLVVASRMENLEAVVVMSARGSASAPKLVE